MALQVMVTLNIDNRSRVRENCIGHVLDKATRQGFGLGCICRRSPNVRGDTDITFCFGMVGESVTFPKRLL